MVKHGYFTYTKQKSSETLLFEILSGVGKLCLLTNWHIWSHTELGCVRSKPKKDYVAEFGLSRS